MMRFALKRGAVEKLRTSRGVRADIERRAAALAAACNAESTWGGYDWAPADNPTRATARVWSISGHAYDDNARSNRMVRLLGGTMGAEDPNDLIDYTTKAGVTRKATRAQVANWTRGSRT